MTGPVRYEKGESQLVLTAPHIGTEIPEGLVHKLDVARLEEEGLWPHCVDIGVADASGFKHYASAARIWPTFPRILLDPNRTTDDIDGLSVECLRGGLDPMGMIWRCTAARSEEEILPILTDRYTTEEFNHLLKVLYTPWVAAVQDAMDRAVERHGQAIMFELHSMPLLNIGKCKRGVYRHAYMFGVPDSEADIQESDLPDLMLLNGGNDPTPKGITDIIYTVFSDHGFKVDAGVLRTQKNPDGSKKASAHDQYTNPAKRKYSTALELVVPVDDKLHLDTLRWGPEREARLRRAYHEVFSELEGFRP
ncbi:N-formylglutamate amidohydrolase [Candidatus Woesearchaeota archaeon]|nr:N-formylglutamate amidohydrolase [Candidatus Woesearchaeota archaeon]